MQLTPSQNRLATLLLALMVGCMVLSIVLYPDKSFEASINGLNVWWNFVFPALLPFLILFEILLGLGAIHGLGVMLDPFMRLCFRLPGTGGLAMAMSAAAGPPAGAKVTAELKKQGLIDRNEGERLLAVSYLCSPMFIVAVVGAGFLGSAEFGAKLLVIHYSSFLAAGLILRLLWTLQPPLSRHRRAGQPQARSDSLMRRAASAMIKARHMDGRTFGKLLGDAVITSVQNLMMVGGYIIMFSVVLNVLHLTRIADAISAFANLAGRLAGMPESFAIHVPAGLLEMHLGTYAASLTKGPAHWTAAFIGAALAWGGLAVFFQTRSLTYSADLGLGAFLQGRLIHSACAFVLTLWLWNPLGRLAKLLLPWPVFSLFSPVPVAPAFAGSSSGWLPYSVLSLWIASGLILTNSVILMAVISFILQKFHLHDR